VNFSVKGEAVVTKIKGLVLAACSVFLLSSCSGGSASTDEGSEQTPPTEAVEVVSEEDGEADDATAASDDSEVNQTIPDVIVISYLPQNVIMDLAKQGAQGSGSCLIAVRSAIDSGGNTVELSFGTEFPAMTARMEPSSTNGDQLPCTVEARFVNVPAGASSYTARQTGGTATAGLYNATVNSNQLTAAGNQIVIVEKEEDTSTVDAILDARCLKGKVKSFRIVKNYSEYSGIGRGDDIFVEERVTLKNECDKPVKAVEYSTVYKDVFGEQILSCSTKDTLSIPRGKSKTTPANYGCTIRKGSEYFQNWNTANKSDIETSVVPRKVIFKDGTSFEAA
jgi:hypothetical protein